MQRGKIMEQSTVFMSNKSQAIRLPKAVALPATVKKVAIACIGNARLIAPADQVWDSWFEGLSATDDFMTDREQGTAVQTRDSFD